MADCQRAPGPSPNVAVEASGTSVPGVRGLRSARAAGVALGL